MKILLVCVVALLLCGCATHKPASPAPTAGNDIAHNTDIYLIPLDDFPFEACDSIAQSLTQQLHLRIRPTVNMGAAGLTPFAETTQFSAEDIESVALRAIPHLPDAGPKTAYIVLTQRDINSRDRALRFFFSFHDLKTRVAIVSSARMGLGENGRRASNDVIMGRVTKMVKRSVGDVYYGYSRSTDIRDLMYSPIMKLEDIDQMGGDFLHPQAPR